MISNARYMLLALPMALLAACNQSSNGPTNSANTNAPDGMPPPPAMTAPTPVGTSTMVASTPVSTKLDWDSLPSQVGKYQNQVDLFEHGPISVELTKLLGDKLPVLQRNLEVAGPLQKDGRVFYMTGNAPHQGGQDQAYLLIAPAKKALEVGLWQGGKLTTWKTSDTSISKPGDVQRMLANAEDRPAGATSGPFKATPLP